MQTTNKERGRGKRMKESIKDLWRGNIDPQNDRMLSTPEMKQLQGFICRHWETLWASMTDEQKETFEKLQDCVMEHNHLVEEAIFVYAYRLGAKLMMETLLEDATQNL